MSTINTILDRIEFLACENMTLRKSNESLNHEINKLHDKLTDQSWADQNQKSKIKIKELEDQVVLLGDLLKKLSGDGPNTNSRQELIAKEICYKYYNSPDKRISMIKDFRTATNCSLMEAKGMIDSIVPLGS